jgi:hypothetical protein
VLKKNYIGNLLILIFLVCFSLSCPASAGNSELNDSQHKEISDSSIKELTNDSSFIAYRGTLPEVIGQKWENSIVNCWLNLTQMGPSYSEFDSSIKNVASNNKVIIIELGSAYKAEVNDSRIDEIYRKINDYCKRQEGISDIPVVFMWAQDEEDLSLPDYGLESFERAKNETGFITTRGTMPEIHREEEKREWIDLLAKSKHLLSSHSNNTGINTYFTKFGGPVNSFGVNINGYLIVGFEPSTPEKVNESVIDEIYKVIDEHFEKEGINDVPVVFIFVRITDDLAPADGPDANESNNTNLSDNKEKNVSNEETNKTPGFTSIMVILGLLSLIVIKKIS